MTATQPDLPKIAGAVCATRGFSLIKAVGKGAFKQTFQVRDANGVDFALKVYAEATLTDRALREVESLRRCDHKKIARLIDLASTIVDGRVCWYLIEEFLAGGSLTSRLSSGPLDRKATVIFAIHFAEVFAHLHSLQLVHRDLKPDNIMFRDTTEVPVVVDFGLVRDLNATSLTMTWCPLGPGTPYYASPEQLTNQKALIDWRSDQFGLGVVIAEARFGVHPFARAGEDDGKTVDRVANHDVPSPVFLDRVKADGLEPLARMLRPWPVDRFRLPQDLLAAWKALGGAL